MKTFLAAVANNRTMAAVFKRLFFLKKPECDLTQIYSICRARRARRWANRFGKIGATGTVDIAGAELAGLE
jgi:hypothetical protein